MKEKNEIIALEKYIDFSLLDARATTADLEKLCDVAYKNQYKLVCVNSANIKYVAGYVKAKLNGALGVSAVVGFPLGATLTDVKILETRLAVKDGADEIGCVINIGKVKSGDFGYVKNEISKIRKETKGIVLKVIIEACYLTENEIASLVKICEKNKVDFIETSTGFGVSLVSIDKIKFMLKLLTGKCRLKVSGGIKTREQAIELINLGVLRIGTSKIL